MIDLETLGTAPGSAVVAIGAVDSDGREFYRTISIKSCLEAGLTVDGDTLAWWFSQSSEAIKQTFGSPTIGLLDDVLTDFARWVAYGPGSTLEKGHAKRLWGNSAAFDLGLLAAAYRALGWALPWSYREEACYRTLKNLVPEVKAPPFEGVEHNALDDAKNQMRHLVELLRGRFYRPVGPDDPAYLPPRTVVA